MNRDPSPRGGSRSHRRRKHARAEELRDAALSLFIEKGFGATRTEEIAARAGVAKGTLYLYYPSKQKLLEAAIASPALKAGARVPSPVELDGNRADALRRLLSDVWSQLDEEGVCNVLTLAVAEARQCPEILEAWLRGVAAPLRSAIAELVLQGMDRGEFRMLDPDAVADSLLLPLLMSCLQRRVVGTCAQTDRRLGAGFVAQHVELVLRGLCRDPRTP